MSLNQIELVWVRVRVEKECFWVNLREDNKVSESKMAVIQDGRIQDGCHHLVSWIELVWVIVRVEKEWFWVNLREVTRCLNPIWQNSRWLPSSSWVRMNQWSFFVQLLGTNLGKCEWVWQGKLRWLNPRWSNSSWQNSRWLLSSSWVRMNEWSFFCANGGNQSWQVWVSLRKQTKMDESKMAKFKMAVFMMAAII